MTGKSQAKNNSKQKAKQKRRSYSSVRYAAAGTAEGSVWRLYPLTHIHARTHLYIYKYKETSFKKGGRRRRSSSLLVFRLQQLPHRTGNSNKRRRCFGWWSGRRKKNNNNNNRNRPATRSFTFLLRPESTQEENETHKTKKQTKHKIKNKTKKRSKRGRDWPANSFSLSGTHTSRVVFKVSFPILLSATFSSRPSTHRHTHTR